MRMLCLFLCSLLLLAQDATFSTGVKVVNVLATVRDKQGKIVQNLTKDDFALTEDGRSQTIRYFSKDTDLPLTLGLLVDISGSQRRVLGQESSASYQFLQQVLREDKDLAFIIHFDKEIELLQDLTSSRRKLENALQSVGNPVQSQQQQGGYGGRGMRVGGGTSLYDSVMLASDDVMHGQAGRKAVVILSDGVDTSSKVSIERSIEAAQRADTMIYSILFSDDSAYGSRSPVQFGGRGMGGGGRRGGGGGYPPVMQRHPDGKKVLQRLAQETGGGFFEVSGKLPIDQVFRRIEEELRTQYNLGYSSDKAEGSRGFRSIGVTVAQRGLIVQTRNGYYAGE